MKGCCPEDFMAESHDTAVQLARVSEAVRQLEIRTEEGTNAVREAMVGLRDDMRADMKEIREGLGEDVKQIASNVANLHNRLQNPDSGIIKIVDDHERRLKAVEAIIASIRNGLKKLGWWALLGVGGFLAIACVRYAHQIGAWIASIKSPPPGAN